MNTHSTELTSPGLAPADWLAVFRKWWMFCCQQIRMSTTAGSLSSRAPTNICRKASTPPQQHSSPSLRFSYLCSPWRSGGTLSQRAELPTSSETLRFPTVRRAHVQGLAVSEDICFELNHSSDLQQGLDGEAKPELMMAYILLFPPPWCSERGTNNLRLWELLG